MTKKLRRKERRNKRAPIPWNNNQQQSDGRTKTSLINDIESELEQQRARKTANSASMELSPPSAPPPKLLGGFRYDPDRHTYFPIHSQDPDNKSFRQCLNSPTTTTRSNNHQPTTSSILPALELCTSIRKRRDLSLTWTGRLLASSCKVVPTMTQHSHNYTTIWTSMLPQLQSSYLHSTILDLNCKTRLLPSTRTFDVLNDGTIATLVEGGFFVRRPPLRTWTEQDYETRIWQKQTTFGEINGCVIRFASPQLLVIGDNHFNDLKFIYLKDNDQWYSDTLECRGNGFNDFHVTDTLVAYAPTIPKQSNQSVTLFHDIPNDRPITMERVRFGSSESLCVEPLGQDILHGHRNGTWTLIDRKCQAPVIRSQGNDSKHGSITGFIANKDSHSVLAKRSFGSVLSYDMRMIKTALHELRVPPDLIHPTFSSCCAGVALDPTNELVISPYSDVQQQVHLAIWSLHNGALVGTKQMTTSEVNIGLPHFELCKTITHAWDWSKHLTNGGNNHDHDPVVLKPKGRWGLWFKSGAIEQSAPNKMGSIHHVHFPGLSN